MRALVIKYLNDALYNVDIAKQYFIQNQDESLDDICLCCFLALENLIAAYCIIYGTSPFYLSMCINPLVELVARGVDPAFFKNAIITIVKVTNWEKANSYGHNPLSMGDLNVSYAIIKSLIKKLIILVGFHIGAKNETEALQVYKRVSECVDNLVSKNGIHSLTDINFYER